MKYPEHEKLKKIKDQSQAIGDFLEWLAEEKNYSICETHNHDDYCQSKNGYMICDFQEGEQLPTQGFNKERLLAEFFKINLNKLEKEKQHMLEQLRKTRQHV